MKALHWIISGCRHLATRSSLVHLRALLPACAMLTTAQPLLADAIQYSYDSMQRLNAVIYPDGTRTDYLYDSFGNRLAKTTTLSPAIANNSPNPVSNPGIANAAVNVPSSPTLTWAATTDPNGDPVAYFLYLGTTPTPPLVYSGWQTSFTPGQLQCFTTYYWYLIARDSHNSQATGPVWSFTTGDTPPNPDFIVSLASGQAPLTVTFQDQSHYNCGLGTSWQWDFNNDGTVDSTSHNPLYTYTVPGDYTVKLVAGDEHGGQAAVTKTNFISVLGPNIVDLAPLDAKVLSAGPYRNLVVSYTVTNTGIISLSGKWQWSDGFYLTTNQVVDDKATLVGLFDEHEALPAGAVYRRTNLVSLPPLDNLAGYRLFLKVNANGLIKEINAGNNVLEAKVARGWPDLAVGNLNWSGQAIAGQQVNVSYSVTNVGQMNFQGLPGTDVEFFDNFYISTNATWDANAIFVGGSSFSGALPPGAGYAQTNEAVLPSWPPGNYYLFVRANDGGTVVESSQANNLVSMPISWGAPDLIPLKITVPPNIASDARIDVVYTVTNRGNAPALDSWMDSLYLATNAVWNDKAYKLGDFIQDGPIPIGGSYLATNSVRLPGWPAGAYSLIVRIDPWGFLAEASKDNNDFTTPLTLLAPAGLPDLQPGLLTAPGSALPGNPIQLVYGVTNTGNTPVTGDWFDMVWFSTNAVYDSTATAVAYIDVSGPLASGAGYLKTNELTIPKVNPGTYYLIVQANAFGVAEESTTTNNFFSRSIVVQPPSLLPDLAIVSLTAPAVVKPGQTFPFTYVVTNQGGSLALNPWFDYMVLSTDTTLDGSVGFVGFWSNSSDLAAGASYTNTQTSVLSSVAEGAYYLCLQVDFVNSVNESTKDNNLLAVPISVATSLPQPTPIVLADAAKLPSGALQFTFTNTSGLSFTVFSTTNVAQPLSLWRSRGTVTETSPGHFQFTDPQPGSNTETRFYRIRSP